MNIGASGIIVNQHGELLVIQRDDTRTWAIPGGALDAGEMPTEGVVREVEEETGFKVMPVRLVSVHYVPLPSRPVVTFMFRCLMRGGEPKTSRESLRVGYVKTNPLKVRMLNFHKQRILPALTHRGKATFATYELSAVEKVGSEVLRRLIYPAMNVRRRWFSSGNEYVPPDSWRIGVFVVIRNEAGAVLWVQRRDDGLWRLPGGYCSDDEAPWDAAQGQVAQLTGLGVEMTELIGVYTVAAAQEQIMVFSAEIKSGTLRAGPASAETAWCQPSAEQPNTLPSQVDYVSDAVDPNRELTRFKQHTSHDAPTAA